jgi:hypothetical protein
MGPLSAADTPTLMYQLRMSISWIYEAMDDLKNLRADVNKSVGNAPGPVCQNWERLEMYLSEIGTQLIQRCEKTHAKMVDLQENFIRIRLMRSSTV